MWSLSEDSIVLHVGLGSGNKELVRYLGVVGNIQNPDYETVTAECEHCGSLCVFNRIDDIGEPGPYDGRYVTCRECRQQFWIYGDIINPAYELLIHRAGEHFGTKRYMQCVAILAQAWEVFFSAFAYSNYLYHPFFAGPRLMRSVGRLNQLSSQLVSATRRYTFYPLRNVLTNTMIKGVHPRTLQESEAAISRISDENLGHNPTRKDIETFPKGEVRDLLEQLQQLRIGDLRNAVIHQRAYRPGRAEVEKCLTEEIGLLHRAKRALPVYSLDEWRARSARTGGER